MLLLFSLQWGKSSRESLLHSPPVSPDQGHNYPKLRVPLLLSKLWFQVSGPPLLSVSLPHSMGNRLFWKSLVSGVPKLLPPCVAQVLVPFRILLWKKSTAAHNLHLAAVIHFLLPFTVPSMSVAFAQTVEINFHPGDDSTSLHARLAVTHWWYHALQQKRVIVVLHLWRC